MAAVLLALLAILSPCPVRAVLRGARGPALIPVLGGTGRLQLAFGALAPIGLLLGSSHRSAHRSVRGVAARSTPMHDRSGESPRAVKRSTRDRWTSQAQEVVNTRALEVGGVPGAGDTTARAGHAPIGRPRSAAANFASARRRRSAPASPDREAVPQRLLRAGAGEAKARRQAVDGVARRSVESAVGAGAGEQRLRHPPVEEGVDAVTLERVASASSARPPGGPLGVVVDARRWR